MRENAKSRRKLPWTGDARVALVEDVDGARHVLVTSIDGSCHDVKTVRSGDFGAVGQQYPFRMGELGVKAVLRYLHDGTKPKP
jgi:ABC-type sugar transport system substrate-binding protein